MRERAHERIERSGLAEKGQLFSFVSCDDDGPGIALERDDGFVENRISDSILRDRVAERCGYALQSGQTRRRRIGNRLRRCDLAGATIELLVGGLQGLESPPQFVRLTFQLECVALELLGEVGNPLCILGHR